MRRKATFATCVVLVAALGAMAYWPRPRVNLEARRVLDEWRALVHIDEAGESPPAIVDQVEDAEIELQVRASRVYMTDATAGLFALPVAKHNKPTVGRVKGVDRFVEIMANSCVAELCAQPTVAAKLGQAVDVHLGSEIPIVTGGLLMAVNDGSAMVDVRRVEVTILPNLTANKTVSLKMDYRLWHEKGPWKAPVVHGSVHRETVTAELNEGESIVVGGLTHKDTETSRVNIPYMCDLPGIGSWFSFNQRREIDIEVVVLITPRRVRTENKTKHVR